LPGTSCIERFVTAADGLRLFCRDYQNDSRRIPVLCLPGLTRNSLDFAGLASRLCRSRRVICPDLRGRGRSEYDPEWRHYNPATYAADTWQLLDELGVAQVAIVGTSLGGWMAMLLHYQRPQRVAAAVINDIGPEANPDGIARILATAGRLDKVADFAHAVAQVRNVYELAFPDWTEAQWRAYTETIYRHVADGGFDLNFDRNIGHAAREGASGLDIDPWTMFDGLRNLPTLLIHGALSDILTEPIIERMCARKPDLAVVSIANRGHAPLLDEQEAVDAIATFLETV